MADTRNAFESQESFESDAVSIQALKFAQSSQKTQTDEKSHKCDFCGKIYLREESLVHHKRRCRLNDKCVICPFCNKPFPNKAALMFHATAHNQIYECDICNKTFSTQNHLMAHKKTVEKDKFSNICDICYLPFATSSKLKVHQLCHLYVQAFDCNYCEMIFKQLSSLNRHKGFHIDEMPFRCGLCPETFLLHEQLVEHGKTHVAECSASDMAAGEISDVFAQCVLCNYIFGITRRETVNIDTQDVVLCSLCRNLFTKFSQD